MFKIIKKADIVLFIILVIIGLGLSWLSISGSSQGQRVRITADGKEYGTYNLSEDQSIDVVQNGHTNKITIKNGQVQMSYADCHNQVCVDTGKISKTSQSIVCLPNKVVVEIIGGEGEYDAISN